MCFSRTLYDLLQWSHYADGHKGYCIEYDINHTAFSLYGLIDVKYQDITPNHQDNTRDHAYILATKPTCWSYEQETRWLGMASDENQLWSVDGAIQAIYLGWKMDSKRVSEFIDEFGEDFPIYKMEPVKGFYALQAKRIN